MTNYSTIMKKPTYKRFWRVLAVGLILGLVVGLLVGCAIGKTMTVSVTPKVQDIEMSTSTIKQFEPIVTPAPQLEPEPAPELLGQFRVTAYCACEKCCGEWAANRPDGIVYGAAGVELKAGISAASPLPFGTVVEVEGYGEYTIQDRTAQWVVDKYGENLIDLYFDDHEAACAVGLQFLNVYLKEHSCKP